MDISVSSTMSTAQRAMDKILQAVPDKTPGKILVQIRGESSALAVETIRVEQRKAEQQLKEDQPREELLKAVPLVEPEQADQLKVAAQARVR